MIRPTLVFLTASVFSASAFSQASNDSTLNQANIVGVWQVKSDLVSAALQANFCFFNTGKFIYNVSGYSDLNPITGIYGKYKLEKNTLYLKIEGVKELTGFKVVESNFGFQSGPFVLDSGKIVTLRQNDSTYSEHEIKVVVNHKGQLKSVMIDADKYFKLSGDPNKFDKE